MGNLTDSPAWKKELDSVVKAHLEDPGFGVSDLARELGMSRASLHRKIRDAEGTSAGRYIRDTRLNSARELLQEEGLTVSEVAFRTGFSDSSYFSKCFRKKYGINPGDFKKDPHLVHFRKEGKLSARVMILSAVILLSIASVYLFFIRPIQHQEKSIAVLPFLYDSPDTGTAYVISGLREEILENLNQMEDLKVAPQAFSESYSYDDRNLEAIGNSLDVNYILEGQARRNGQKTYLMFQLYETASDRYIWSGPLEREITLDNLFRVQQEVALAVATDLDAILTRAEKEQVMTVPTQNRPAYYEFLKARHWIRIANYERPSASEDVVTYFRQAVSHLKKAVQLDSSFARGHIWLGFVYGMCLYPQMRWELEMQPDQAAPFLDTSLAYLDTASGLNTLPGDRHFAMQIQGFAQLSKGNKEKGYQILKAIPRRRSNQFSVYESEINISYALQEYERTVKAYLEYLKRKPDDVIAPLYLLQKMAVLFRKTGHTGQSADIRRKLLDLTGDSSEFFFEMAVLYYWQGEFSRSQEYVNHLKRYDSVNTLAYASFNHLYLNHQEEALAYWNSYLESDGTKSIQESPNRTVLALYYEIGKEEEAAKQLAGLLPEYEARIDSCDHLDDCASNHLVLSSLYAFSRKEELAVETLRPLVDLNTMDAWYLRELECNPLYNPIRNDRQFREICKILKRKHRDQHRRISRILKQHTD